jgi:hypothetical protein
MKKIIFILLLAVSTSYAEEAKKEVVAVAAPVTEVKAAPAEVIAVMPEEAPVLKNLPPVWLEKALDIVSSMPVVGPVVVEVLKWLGVVSSVLTALVTALLGILLTLRKVLNLAKLADLALKIELFMNGPIMFWLKYFSIYNAKKEEKSDASGPAKAS